MGSRLRLSVAIGDYFHIRHFVDGRISVAGLDPIWLQLQNEEILQRAFKHREFDVSEFSLAQYVALRAAGHDSLIAIPVFPSRVFRHGSIFVRRGEITEPSQLVGRRVGIPEWVQTAGVWTRGILAEDFGLDLKQVEWVQGGVLVPGREEHISVALPEGIHVRAEREVALTDLLLAGQIDAIVSARAPGQSGAAGPIGRMFEDSRRRELEWGLRTQIVPIMHVIVLRRDTYEQAPWIARGLLDGFERAKRAALDTLTDLTVSAVPVPWVGEQLHDLAGLFGHDWWAYGVEPNRPTLEAFLRYCRTQGIGDETMQVDDLFAPETLGEVRI